MNVPRLLALAADRHLDALRRERLMRIDTQTTVRLTHTSLSVLFRDDANQRAPFARVGRCRVFQFYFDSFCHVSKIKKLLFVNHVVSHASGYILAVAYPHKFIYRSFYPNILKM